MKILFIRHGQTEYNLKRRWSGSTDIDVCENGINLLKQRINLFDKYRDNIQKLYSSPMKRCIQTSNIYFPKKSIIKIEELRERDFGDWEGKSYEEVHSTKEFEIFAKSEWHSNTPNGEDYNYFFDRIKTGYKKIVDDMIENKLECVALVSHGGVTMGILSLFEKQKLKMYDYAISNGECFLTNIDKDYSISIIEKF